MHNIVLHISIYLFPWLHVFYDPSPINNARKHAILAIFIIRDFRTLIFDGWSVCVCVGMHSAHNASRKMTLCVMAVNILTFTPIYFFKWLSK